MSGTTALCALYRPLERSLVVGWVGDSKALLVSQNRVLQIVNPHKPDSEVSARYVVNASTRVGVYAICRKLCSENVLNGFVRGVLVIIAVGTTSH